MSNVLLNNFQKYCLNVNDYNVNGIILNKSNYSIDLKLNDVSISIPYSKFDKIVKNNYGNINFNNQLFKMIKPSSNEIEFEIIISNQDKLNSIYLNKNSESHLNLINYLSNEKEICGLYYDKKQNNYSMIIGLEKNILELNIHNVFSVSNLTYEEIKPLIDYYLSNSNNVLYSNTLFESNHNVVIFESNNIKNNNNIEKLLSLMIHQIKLIEFEKNNQEEIINIIKDL